MQLTEKQIKHMVDRFLAWRLPADFSPDAGISFKPTFNDHLPTPTKHNPSGTNLFTATQAEAMVRYMALGMPEANALNQFSKDMGAKHASATFHISNEPRG